MLHRTGETLIAASQDCVSILFRNRIDTKPVACDEGETFCVPNSFTFINTSKIFFFFNL